MEFLKKIKTEVWVFLGLSIIILWQMLLPGYILTLDMVYAPKFKIVNAIGEFLNPLPFELLLKGLNYVLDGWIIQKIVLLAMFFIIGYFGYKYIANNKISKYWAGIFYLANPFVYERFLAGHYMHLIAYGLLPVFSYYIIKFYENPDLKNSLKTFIALLFIGLFSLHFLIISIILFFLYSLYVLIVKIIKKDNVISVIKNLFIGGIFFLVISSYWLVPYILNRNNSILTTFNKDHIDAFLTAGDPKLGTTFNVLSLYGFWGESQPWARYFIWPKDSIFLWTGLFTLLFLIIIYGIYKSFKNKEYNRSTFFLIAGIIGFIFSCGAGETIFKNFNLWLFNNVWFWSGFRDSQKWSGLLVLSYAYFGSLGAYGIYEYFKSKNKFKKIILYLVFLIPILYTLTIWGGFSRQVKAVWYPNDWHEANNFLNNDKEDFKVLFLPWHQYLSLNFNQKLITGNPAKLFFDKKIFQGENMELKNIYSQEGDEENKKVEKIVLNSSSVPIENTVNLLNDKNIKYIIFINDLGEGELPKFLKSESEYVKKAYISNDLTIYKIMVP